MRAIELNLKVLLDYSADTDPFDRVRQVQSMQGYLKHKFVKVRCVEVKDLRGSSNLFEYDHWHAKGYNERKEPAGEQ